MSYKRILVIDDEEPIQEVIQCCLEDIGGWQVWLASSGLAGIALAQEIIPDGILLDVMMPELDGLLTLTKIRATPTIADIPVVLLTARNQDRDRSQFDHLHVLGTIIKPFDPMTIVDRVAAAFGW
jgi:two-component system, OmpR family, alkaline phosphatase synthesis response regulator PhoP